MAKTVFGMPGLGDKSKGGDAVAPGGSPGSKTGEGLPQKSGEQAGEPKRTTKPAANPTPMKPAAPKPTAPKPSTDKAPAAKPVQAPMAKPAAPVSAKPAGGGGGGGKTMFGMPAMKMPGAPGGAPTWVY